MMKTKAKASFTTHYATQQIRNLLPLVPAEDHQESLVNCSINSLNLWVSISNDAKMSIPSRNS